MCTAAFQEVAKSSSAKGKPGDDKKVQPIRSAQEVPLGTGLADAAKVSILSQRERMAKAMADAGV